MDPSQAGGLVASAAVDRAKGAAADRTQARLAGAADLVVGFEELDTLTETVARVLTQAYEWQIINVRDADDAVAQLQARYEGMSPVHTVNNLALVVWALLSHPDDFGAAIGEAVAAGWDTARTRDQPLA